MLAGKAKVTGGNIWYGISGEGDGVPIILVHGGPGFNHHTFEVFDVLGGDRPVVMYDQLGCGASDKPGDLSLYSLAGSVRELGELVASLNLDRVHLLGHSWGAAIVAEYIMSGFGGVESAVLASPILSIPVFNADVDRLLQKLPPEHVQALLKGRETGDYDSPGYRTAQSAFTHAFTCITKPWPKSLMEAIHGINWGLVTHMLGHADPWIDGAISGLDLTPGLGEVDIPILYTCGRHDQITLESVKGYCGATPKGVMAVFEKSAHMTYLDEPELYADTVRNFIKGVA